MVRRVEEVAEVYLSAAVEGSESQIDHTHFCVEQRTKIKDGSD